MTHKIDWTEKTKGLLKSELKRHNVTYAQLVEKSLRQLAGRRRAVNIRNKITRRVYRCFSCSVSGGNWGERITDLACASASAMIWLAPTVARSIIPSGLNFQISIGRVQVYVGLVTRMPTAVCHDAVEFGVTRLHTLIDPTRMTTIPAK